MHEFRSCAQRLPLEPLPHHELMLGELRAAPPTALLLPLALQGVRNMAKDEWLKLELPMRPLDAGKSCGRRLS